MIVDLYWPRTILPPRSVMVELANATMGGGRTLTAIDQFVRTDAGYWKITLSEIPFASKQQKLSWRAVSAQLGGRLGIIGVPIYDPNTPWPIVNGEPVTSYGQVPHSDDTFFSDGTGYAQDVISAEITADAALGATTIHMKVTVGSTLSPGMHWSVANRLERIKSISSVVENEDGTVDYVMKVTPPLREPIANGTSVNFDDPHCACRLATDAEMETGVDDYAARTLAKVDFVEALP